MSLTIDEVKNECYTYYYENKKDVLIKSKKNENAWIIDTCRRIGSAYLPLISLYKPLGFPISLAKGGLHTYKSIRQLIETIQTDEIEEIPLPMIKAMVSVIALAGKIFPNPFSTLVSTGNSLATEVCDLVHNLQAGQHKKAAESCLKIVSNSLYLAHFLHGGLELYIALIAIKILMETNQVLTEYRKSQAESGYIESSAHFLMSIVHGNRVHKQTEVLLYRKWPEPLKKKIILPRRLQNSGSVDFRVLLS